MKNFFTSFCATLTALAVVVLGGAFILLLLLGAAASLGEKPVVVPSGAYLVVDLSTRIQDAPAQMEDLEELMEAFGGQAPRRIQLRQLTRAIDAAAADSDIAGLFLHGELAAGGAPLASLREVRASIERFRAAGKPVKAFLGYAGTAEYYLASAASEVTQDPYGLLLMPGLASQPMFLARAFDKLGVGVQVTRVGKYKSAVEPFTREDMSPENRAQVQMLLDDLWRDVVAGVEQGRGLEGGALQRVVDAQGFIRPPGALAARLVDRVAYWDVMLEDLKADTGRKGARETFKQIDVKSYAKLVSGDGLVAHRRGVGKVEPAPRERIGIVYAEGEIVDGDGDEEGVVYGAKVARQLRDLRLDDSVKAVVLRVNSPGGSASASEMIQREVRLTREKKPVVVSMGPLAASGGYWIAAYGNRIFAEPTTITGSIGVFGMFLNFQELANDKLGLTFDTVKTGRFADAFTVVRPKTEAELALFQGLVDWIYDEFLGRVADARGIERTRLEEIAQGRVWSGAEALKLGLVDELGGLSAAVAHAASLAKVGERFRVVELPRRKAFAEALTEAFEGRRRDLSEAGPAGVLLDRARRQVESLVRMNDPRGVYARLAFDLEVR